MGTRLRADPRRAGDDAEREPRLGVADAFNGDKNVTYKSAMTSVRINRHENRTIIFLLHTWETDCCGDMAGAGAF